MLVRKLRDLRNRRFAFPLCSGCKSSELFYQLGLRHKLSSLSVDMSDRFGGENLSPGVRIFSVRPKVRGQLGLNDQLSTLLV